MLNELLIIIALVLANGFFSGAEIAIVSMRKTRIVELVDEGNRAARVVAFLRKHPERFLATVQVGITVVGSTAAAFGGASIAVRLQPFFASYPRLAPHADDLALGTVVVLISYLSIVLGELVPKSLALRSAERYALLVARPITFLSWISRPIVWLLTFSSNLVLKPFGDRTTFTESRMSSEELQQLVSEGAESGAVHPEAAQIAAKALEFGNLLARDVMVPRPDVILLSKQARPEDLRALLLEHAHSRMPVYDGEIDNVVGYISIKDVVALAWEQQLIVLEDIIRPAYIVPEHKLAVEILQDMRRQRVPFAIVVDERGGLAGIITFEDLAEELVGEVFDEHDTALAQPIIKEGPQSYLILGSATIRELNRELELWLPEDAGWNTIAGFCMDQFGHVPKEGEVLTLPEGARLEVISATPRRIRQLRLHVAPTGGKEEPEK